MKSLSAEERQDRPEPRVSIGMPVYNGAETVQTALDSLLAQSYRDFELIISDNASTDGTSELLARYAGDDRVRVIRQPSTLPMIENFSSVFHEARGTYFMWAARDDYWNERFVEALVRVLDANPSCGVAMASVEVVDADGVKVRETVYDGGSAPQTLTRAELFQRAVGLTEGAPLHLFIYGLHRRRCLEAVLGRSFPTGIAGDRVLMSELALTAGFRSVPDVLYRRTVYDATIDLRYPDDDLGAVWRAGARQRRYLIALARRTMTSPLVGPADKLRIVLPTILRLTWRRRAELRNELRRPRGGR